MSSLATTFKEVVDCLRLFSRQWPLPHDTVLGAWLQVNLMANAFILRQFASAPIREYVFVF